MTLRVCYSTHEFDEVDIHLRTLRSNQEFDDKDGVAEKLGISSASWPIFGVVWPAGQVLAHHIFKSDFADKRILEVGCGIGLTSLLLNHLHADITATDYHPEAENFLLRNSRLNQDEVIPFVRTGWSDKKSELGEFDLIVGSDLLYEDEHIDMLAAFVKQHCKPHCDIILVDPGRGRHARFSRRMEALGFTLYTKKPTQIDYLDKPFKGVILRYVR
ncbi:MAG: methyltransferase domain-containing protein [Oceanospirillaceae bacterium]|nr:methyltransferase domain-containing protein [Oceanospirillaceae bacterium]